MITLKVSPLSVNRAWQGRRYKTPEYTAYEKEVALLLPAHKRPGTMSGMLEVTYRFYFKNHKMRDFDNPIKPITDILVKLGVIADDRNIYRATIEKIPSTEDYVEIEILPYVLP